MNHDNTSLSIPDDGVADPKTCGCGPDCRCGPDCACGPDGVCNPACTCGG